MRGAGSGQGVSNMLFPPPNTQHTPGRGSKGLWLGRWGGHLPAEGTISPHPPPWRQNWQGAPEAEAEAAGWRGAAGAFAEEFSLLPQSWEPWERGRAVGRRTTGLDLHFRRWKEGWQLGGHIMAPRAGEQPVSDARPPARATRAH